MKVEAKKWVFVAVSYDCNTGIQSLWVNGSPITFYLYIYFDLTKLNSYSGDDQLWFGFYWRLDKTFKGDFIT